MKTDNLIFDGRHMLYRTSDAFKILSVEIEGREVGTGGMYGFLNVAVRIFRRYGGRVWVAWEGKRSRNFRRDLYPEYKRKREPDSEQLEFLVSMGEQERRLQAMLRAMGVLQFRGAHCEADDVMAWIATDARERGETSIIYTGDSDLRQLVGPGISVAAPGFKSKDVLYDTAESVKEKHGVVPEKLADLKALAGDSSDNIPGVRGIGPKTGATLINQYGSVKNVIEAAREADGTWPVSHRFRQLILDAEADLSTFLALTQLQTAKDVHEIERKRSQKTLINHFKAYHFRSLMVPNELMDLMRMGSDVG